MSTVPALVGGGTAVPAPDVGARRGESSRSPPGQGVLLPLILKIYDVKVSVSSLSRSEKTNTEGGYAAYLLQAPGLVRRGAGSGWGNGRGRRP
ncbi:hypothetical protein GCM10027294_46020 [Marinactinospora endophytica]